MSDDFYKYCGLGVNPHEQTRYGVQIKVIQSSVPTPAMLMDLRDGDIIHSVRVGGDWKMIDNAAKISRYLTGPEGAHMELRVLRGHELIEKSNAEHKYGYHHKDDETVREVNLEAMKLLEVNAKRARIYPSLPEGVPLEEVPFRSPNDQLKCFLMSELPVEGVDFATLNAASPSFTPAQELAKAAAGRQS